MRPLPDGAGPGWPDGGDPDDGPRDDRAARTDAELAAARRALRRLGGELRDTSRSLDGSLDLVDDGSDGGRDIGDDRTDGTAPGA